MPMLRDFALTGSGFGSFEEVFPRFQPAGSVARWNRAHNDYLEVLVEGGRLKLGTWQGIFLTEFDGPRSRKVWIRVGE